MPRGNKSKLDFDLKLSILEMAEAGLTDMEICEAIGVTKTTLYVWRRGDDDLETAFRTCKKIADDRVERSLYQNAVGYDLPTHKYFYDKEAGGVIAHPIVEHVKADTTAAVRWLETRKANEWIRRERRELTGADGAPLNEPLEPREVARRVAAMLLEAKLGQSNEPSSEGA
jgi:DNA-binding XRE family transcriptional regulator